MKTEMKIHTDEEYQKTLDEIWSLHESASDEQKLKSLTAALHEYEEQNYPM